MTRAPTPNTPQSPPRPPKGWKCEKRWAAIRNGKIGAPSRFRSTIEIIARAMPTDAIVRVYVMWRPAGRAAAKRERMKR